MQREMKKMECNYNEICYNTGYFDNDKWIYICQYNHEHYPNRVLKNFRFNLDQASKLTPKQTKLENDCKSNESQVQNHSDSKPTIAAKNKSNIIPTISEYCAGSDFPNNENENGNDSWKLWIEDLPFCIKIEGTRKKEIPKFAYCLPKTATFNDYFGCILYFFKTISLFNKADVCFEAIKYIAFASQRKFKPLYVCFRLSNLFLPLIAFSVLYDSLSTHLR